MVILTNGGADDATPGRVPGLLSLGLRVPCGVSIRYLEGHCQEKNCQPLLIACPIVSSSITPFESTSSTWRIRSQFHLRLSFSAPRRTLSPGLIPTNKYSTTNKTRRVPSRSETLQGKSQPPRPVNHVVTVPLLLSPSSRRVVMVGCNLITKTDDSHLSCSLY